MSKSERRTPRKPATKFPNLLKKFQQQQAGSSQRYYQPRKPRSRD